jgi:hypothetical protein
MTTGEIVFMACMVIVVALLFGAVGIVSAAWLTVKVRQYRRRSELTHLRETRQWWGRR